MIQNEPYDVALAACDRYEDTEVEAALREALEAIDGLSFVKPGMRIAVKVNLVTAMKPDTAATVHPSVVCALVRLLRELGAEVVLGDGPGGIYSAGYLRVVYDVCGMRQSETASASSSKRPEGHRQKWAPTSPLPYGRPVICFSCQSKNAVARFCCIVS